MQPTCPTCHTAPPPLVPCDACEEEHAPFVTAGACPRCALVWDTLTCAACERRSLLEAWVPDGLERRAFLARLLGGDAPKGDEQVGAWTAAWRKAARVVATEVTELFAPVDETTDPTPLRAGILDAEDALEAARRGERELLALASEASAAVLAPELEAARKASRSAVDAATRALEGARRDAEELHRRLLDRKRTPPVEPPAPAPIEPNPPPAAQCPSCAWRPDGYPRWECARCDTRYDAFATNARCPACARRFAQTACLACKAWAPIAEWRRAGGGEVVEEPIVAAVEPAASTTLQRLASRVTSAFDRSDPSQETVAGSLERAAGVTDRAVGQVADWVASLQDDGVGAARLGAKDWRGVADECTRTLRTKPDHAVALAARGFARMKLQDDLGARADLDAALSAEGLAVTQRAWTLTTRARMKDAVHDFAGAIADATAAIALAPATPQGHLFRATARFHLGQLDEAVVDLDEEVRVATPETAPDAAAMRAAVQLTRGGWAAADADATDALARGYPRARLLYSIRASSRSRLGQVDAARADATYALRLAPGHGGAFGERARLRAIAGDASGALVELARLRRHDPWGERSSERFALAIEAHLRGERERATALLRRQHALSADPEYSSLWLRLLVGVDDPFPPPRDGWAGDLARFAQGSLTEEGLLKRAARPIRDRSTPAERACEAHGYAGLRAEREDRAADAARSFRTCVASGLPVLETLWAALRLAGVTPRAVAPAAPAPAPEPAPAPAPTLTDQLERLARLREQGILTPDEFAQAKRRLLEG